MDKFRREIGRRCYPKKVVDERNRLSNHIVSGETMGSYKRRLDKFMDEDDRWNQAAVLTETAKSKSNALSQLPLFS